MSHIIRIAVKRYVGITCITLTALLSTIGSGGGGGGVDSPEPLVYTGNTNPAIITVENAPALVYNLIGGSNIAGAIEEPDTDTLQQTENTEYI